MRYTNRLPLPLPLVVLVVMLVLGADSARSDSVQSVSVPNAAALEILCGYDC